MSDAEILKKALEKAGANGFVGDFGKPECGMSCDAQSQESEGTCVYSTIFSHEFAKAFWGDGEIYSESPLMLYEFNGDNDLRLVSEIPQWQFCLQSMVLEEEPLKYLERFLND